VGLAVDVVDVMLVWRKGYIENKTVSVVYHCTSVLSHCWLGRLACKIVSEVTCDVASGTLNPTIPLTIEHYYGCFRHTVCTHFSCNMTEML